MITRKLLVSILILAGVLLQACASPAPTSAPTSKEPAAIRAPTKAAVPLQLTTTQAPTQALSATTSPIPATSTQPPQATAVPATPTSVPTVAIDPDRPNDLTEARLRVSQCFWADPNDVYMNGKVPVTAGVPLTNMPSWGGVSCYEYLAPGTVSVAVVPTGMGIHTASLAPLDVTLEAGHRYTVVFLGESENASHKALVIDETEAYQEAGATPNSAGHITVNNIKGAPAISFGPNGVGENDVPYGGLGASASAAGKIDYLGLSVGGRVIERSAPGGYTWPGYDLLDCNFGFYTSPTNHRDFSWTSEPTSSLNAIDFLQGASEQHVKNGGEVFGNIPSFDIFLTAVKNASLTDLLTGDGPHLIFAPNDIAFARLPKGQLDALMADPKALGDFVRAYIVEGYYPKGTLGENLDEIFDRTLINLLGKELALSGEEEKLKINGGSMGQFDSAMMANGTRVIWVENLMKPDSK
jgi:uncharacterized surface protein with fasciclin (FAS1) repeats